MSQEITKQDDELLLKTLKGFQSELQNSEIGSLNGFSQDALRGLAEAQQRALNLEPLNELQEWSTKQIVVWSEVKRFLELLGRNNDQRLVVALFPPDPGKPMIHLPQVGRVDQGEIERMLANRAADQISLGLVVNRPAPVPDKWGTKPDHFSGKRPSDKERKFQIWNGLKPGVKSRNSPRAWGASNDHIGESVAVWFEGDGGLPIEEQLKFHELIGLPTPTFTVWTGGKSLHSYYVLDVPCTPTKSHFLMDWIATALKRANPDAGADSSLKNPCRVMRCPGGFHGTKGGRAYIYSEHPGQRRYSIDELESALPGECKPSGGTEFKDLAWKNSKAARENWWTRLSPDEKWSEAVLMMEVIPCRQQPSAEGGPAGTREPALKVLGGLGDEFGEDDAVAICVEAQWFNEWWDPAKELAAFNHSYLTIWTVVKAAKEHGYLTPDQRRREDTRKEANKASSAKSPEQGEWGETFDWMLTEERTCEVVVEEALKAEAKETGGEWLSHQETFRRYVPKSGFYERVSHTELKRHITTLLRQIFELKGSSKNPIVVRKQTTEGKAEACARWMASTTAASEMDVVPAVAFTNGTLHLEGNSYELRPHSPDNRLTFAIKGEWTEGAECPPLCREFFRTSYGLEWLHIIRAVIAYSADPRYCCRVLLLLLGNSGTGKGTFERLLEAMFPPESVATLQKTAELDSPEKVAQYVCGTRLLTFPDLQGHQTGLGTLYSLTEAGLLTARPLFSRDTFSFPFTGRVVICATSVPTMENAGSGMARRILPIPTKTHRLSSELLKGLEAENLDRALQAEIGQLVSWALQMPRSEVEAVLRGNDPDGLLRSSRTDVEVNMDATRAFIDQCLAPASNTTIPDRSELFTAYQLFCKARGFKGVCNETSFTNRLKGALPELHRPRTGVPGNAKGAKVPAMFFGFQLIEGLWSSDPHAYYVSMGSHDVERGPSGSNWGTLQKSKLGEGGFAELKGRALEIPTYEELKRAKIV